MMVLNKQASVVQHQTQSDNMLLKQNFANSNTNVIQQENHRNADVTILLATLNKLLQNVEELKNPKTYQWHYKPYNRNKNIELFCDSFGKHIDTQKVFGNKNKSIFYYITTVAKD